MKQQLIQASNVSPKIVTIINDIRSYNFFW